MQQSRLWRLDVTADLPSESLYDDAVGIPVIVFPPAESATVTLSPREPDRP